MWRSSPSAAGSPCSARRCSTRTEPVLKQPAALQHRPHTAAPPARPGSRPPGEDLGDRERVHVRGAVVAPAVVAEYAPVDHGEADRCAVEGGRAGQLDEYRVVGEPPPD